MGRAGAYYVSVHDAGGLPEDHTYRYATLGGGVEYASGGGFTTWAELGPVVVKGDKAASAGAYASVGLGYRFGAPGPTRPIDPRLGGARDPDRLPGAVD